MWDRSHTHGIKGMLTKTVQNGTVRPTTDARDRELAQPCDDQIFLRDGWWILIRPSSSHLTTASSSLARSTVPNSPFGFPKLPRPSTRSPGGSSRLVNSYSTVIIPLDDRVLVIGSLNCAEFSIRLSEVTQTLDAISGSQFLVSGRRLRRSEEHTSEIQSLRH